MKTKTPHSPRITRIQPKQRFSFLEWREIAEYKDLLLFLSLRDIKLRYKQTKLGVVWVILQPLVQAIIFAVLFGNFGRLPSNGQPYLLMVLTGLIPWGLFNGTVGRAGVSLVGSANLLCKIYFPRIILPLASVSSVVLDMMVNLGVFALLMIPFAIVPGWQIVIAPLFLVATLGLAIGVTLTVSAFNVYFRDWGFAVPYVLTVWNYMSPVLYSTELIPEKWRPLYSLNPIVGLVEGFRWSVLGGSPPTSLMIASSCVSLILALLIGVTVFQKIERGFADIV